MHEPISPVSPKAAASLQLNVGLFPPLYVDYCIHILLSVKRVAESAVKPQIGAAIRQMKSLAVVILPDSEFIAVYIRERILMKSP